MASQTILVIGATGKQGQAVLAGLHEEAQAKPASPQPKILALTRSTSSAGAQALKKQYSNVELVQGDMADPEPIFTRHPGITSVFIVTNPSKTEEQEGIRIVDVALKQASVKHIVFTSVERGGDEKSWTNPTNVPHFLSKHAIELHLRDAAAKTTRAGRPVAWTILRPAGFMENFSMPGMLGPGFGAMWNTMPATTKLQLVSTVDIGRVAARALLDPARYAGRAIGLAGDNLTFAQAKAVFRDAVGNEAGTALPQTYWVLGKLLRYAIGDMHKMFSWFEVEGFGVDIEAVRKEEGVMSFAQWLKSKESGFAVRR